MSNKKKEVRSKGKAKGTAAGPKRNYSLSEMTERAREYMGWEDEDTHMGELYTPTRRDMIQHLVEFADAEMPEPDPIARAINAVHQDLVDRFEAFNRRAIRIEEKLTAELERRLPSVPSDPPKEQARFKVGELVQIMGKSSNGFERLPVGSYHKIANYCGGGLYGVSDEKWGYYTESLHSVTEEEIEAHQRASEPVELQENDACYCGQEDIHEVMHLCEEAGIPTGVNWSNSIGMYWGEGRVQIFQPQSFTDKVYPKMPKAEFKRRLQGTIEAHKARVSDHSGANGVSGPKDGTRDERDPKGDAQAQSTGEKVEVEEPKLTFGTRVKFKNRGSFEKSNVEGRYVGPTWGGHIIAYSHHDDPGVTRTTACRRSEFTIIEQ